MKANRFNFRALSDGKWWYSDDEAYVLKMYDGELWLCEDDGYYSQRSGEYRYSKIGKAIQSTGLTDKNGVEIFEGDVVKQPESMNGVITWHESAWYIVCTPDEGFRDPLHGAWEVGTELVIGNIHENPELLEEQPQ